MPHGCDNGVDDFDGGSDNEDVAHAPNRDDSNDDASEEE